MSFEGGKLIWLNRRLVPWEQATVHVLSHALHYGSSVFEGIRVYKTPTGPKVFRLTDHMQRLYDSAKIYRMPIPYRLDELIEVCKEVVVANNLTEGAYIRPIAAITAGLAADRFNARRVIGALFIAMLISYGVLSQIAPSLDLVGILYVNIIISYFGVFGLRGVYFALLEETRIPNDHTGTAVGLISVVGFTPEIFFGPISGRILDHSPGITGHQNYFLLLAGISAVGVVVVLVLSSLLKNAPRQPGP